MPKSYPTEAVQEACGLYMAGLSYEQVAEEMRKRGYAKYSAGTVQRWAKEGGWQDERARQRATEGKQGLLLDAAAQAKAMLESYQALRQQAEDRLTSGALEFSEGVNLLIKVDNLIRSLLDEHGDKGQKVDRPALWLEFLAEFLGDLAAINPNALAAIEPHLDEIKQRVKARFAEAA